MIVENKFYKTVDTNQKRLRLDNYLMSVKIPTSRTRLNRLIKNGHLSVNGEVILSPHFYVKYKDEIIAEFPKEPVLSLEPEDIPIDIIYEDDDIILINKKTDMVVHPAKGNRSGTLVNALLFYSKLSKSGRKEFRPGIVHRLDKKTSGLLVVAKSDIAFKNLQEQIANRSISRKYIALVWGELEKKQGLIDAPIGRSKLDRKKMTVTSYNSKEARTHYKVLTCFGACSLLLCSLDTGRTHQIRVHLQHIGHTVVGDKDYGGYTKYPQKVKKKWNYQINEINKIIERQVLHATYLSFIHPITNKKVNFTAPLHEDIKNLLLYLKNEKIFNK